MGLQHARFDLRDGENFNCGFAELAACVAEELPAVLTQDTQENTRCVRRALTKVIGHLKTHSPAQDKKNSFWHWPQMQMQMQTSCLTCAATPMLSCMFTA